MSIMKLFSWLFPKPAPPGVLAPLPQSAPVGPPRYEWRIKRDVKYYYAQYRRTDTSDWEYYWSAKDRLKAMANEGPFRMGYSYYSSGASAYASEEEAVAAATAYAQQVVDNWHAATAAKAYVKYLGKLP